MPLEEIVRLNTQLAQAIDQEIESRIQAHSVKVQRIQQGIQHRESLKVAPIKPPLDLFAIGDSWFEYPLNGNGLPIENTAIVADSQLGSMGNPQPVILSIALHGQATTAILSWKNQERMKELVTNPKKWVSGKPDAILVSGGGDDIAGDQFAIYLDYNGAGLDKARFQGVLDSVRASYMDLFLFRDRFAKNVPIFGHCYDYALPNAVHPICAGPWLKPSLDFCGYDTNEGLQAIKDAINGFYKLLNDLASDNKNNFILVDTLNTLTADTSLKGWANELHPYPTGFSALANKFLLALRAHFKGRI
jgi:hypothetical protein